MAETDEMIKKIRSPLIICEGIEDGLTLALARPDYRVWVAGSLSLMGLIEWPECASAVVLAADNDWEKPEAVRAFERVEARLHQVERGELASDFGCVNSSASALFQKL